MAEWLRLDRTELAAPHEERRVDAHVEIVYAMSPYDVPDAVRGWYDEDLRRFVIEFKYPQDEPHLETVRETESEPIRLRVGRRMGRLQRIEVDVHALKAKSVGLRMGVSEALRKLASSSEPQRTKNVKVAQEVVEKLGDQMLATSGA